MILLFTALILLVVLVNGWTDAPNAIAGCVSTRALSPRGALILAAICNFVGTVGMAIISPQVASTLYNIVDFGNDPKSALLSLCAGLCAVVIWATIAFRFGLPTSESHALISGITGAALANRMDPVAINFHEWSLVLTGLVATTVLPFILGYIFNRILLRLFKSRDRRAVMSYFFRTQRIGAAASALLHGAQDSQKFMGIYLLGISLYRGEMQRGVVAIPPYVLITCALVMTLGTAMGGAKIIKKVGCDMTELDAVGGSASDAASSVILFVCSILGIPASTTHSKACAMMGTGFTKHRGIDTSVVSQIVTAWLLTFPICGALGFILARLIHTVIY